MQCVICSGDAVRYGKHRNGNQRWYCRKCLHSFCEPSASVAPRVFSDRQLTMEKAVHAITLLVEGNSIRTVCRVVKLGQHTVLRLLRKVGEGCARIQRNFVVNVKPESVQCDELWSFVYCKERTRIKRGFGQVEVGDCYTWTALDPKTKMILAYTIGKRDNETASVFVQKSRRATTGHFQINTDGLGIYRSVIPQAFGRLQDHAQVVKIFGGPKGLDTEARYSPTPIIGITVEVGSGNPDLESASTSYIERSNLTVRMMLRRFTRLTNAHSKSWNYHEAAINLGIVFYNFCRKHMTIKKTPAMAAGITQHAWTVQELIESAIVRDESTTCTA